MKKLDKRILLIIIVVIWAALILYSLDDSQDACAGFTPTATAMAVSPLGTQEPICPRVWLPIVLRDVIEKGTTP
jgi:hypothetical protein